MRLWARSIIAAGWAVSACILANRVLGDRPNPKIEPWTFPVICPRMPSNNLKAKTAPLPRDGFQKTLLTARIKAVACS